MSAATDFITTDTAHHDCEGCAELVPVAISHARVTGSVGATYGDGEHSAKVRRVCPHCNGTGQRATLAELCFSCGGTGLRQPS